jgi:protein tyrosine/serine phosphatase
MSLLLNRLYHLHWVCPEAARSAQPYLGFYGAFLKSNGFRTVVNLRGENARYRWWRNEKKVTSALGVAHFDVRLSSRNIPSRTSLAALFDAFEKGKTPMLIKCSGGQDRSALAAALFLLHRKGQSALAEAEAQFSFWPYLHRPKRHQRWLAEFPAFAAAKAQGMSLSAWAREKYAPEDFAAYLASRGLPEAYRTIQTDS